MEHILKQNNYIANHRYTAYFEPNEEGGYSVAFPSIPEIVTFGDTLDEARKMAVEALQCHLEGLIKDGEPLPHEKRFSGQLVREEIAVSI